MAEHLLFSERQDNAFCMCFLSYSHASGVWQQITCCLATWHLTRFKQFSYANLEVVNLDSQNITSKRKKRCETIRTVSQQFRHSRSVFAKGFVKGTMIFYSARGRTTCLLNNGKIVCLGSLQRNTGFIICALLFVASNGVDTAHWTYYIVIIQIQIWFKKI